MIIKKIFKIVLLVLGIVLNSFSLCPMNEAGQLKRVPEEILQIIKQIAAQENVRVDLAVAITKAESNFNRTAKSHKGAIGLMQLMADTAKQYQIDNLFDAQENIKAGIKHLRYLLTKYKNNIPLVLAAYNAGEGAVEKYKGIPPYRETINYVKTVMSYMALN